ncbi:MAG: ROK family glucokinase [Sedimentisphaerales bacterium]|nr:ROK family glucokinase [Sedimentisphaerales bacterium]
MADYFIGVDLGGTNVVTAILDQTGRLIDKISQPTQAEQGPQSLVERTSRSAESLIEKHSVSRSQLKAMGIGSPGPLSFAEGRIIASPNLPGFEQFPLRAEYSRRLQIPAVLDNDANVACWGEFWLGAGEDVTDMVLFTLGTGIGGGIVCQGELVHGSEDNAAELGHMIIVPDGRRCNCGQHGCLEAYASANQTANRAREALEQGRSSSLQAVWKNNGQVSSKDVFYHAQGGDALALEIVDGTAKALAQASINMRHITEPQKVVLTGGMIKAGDFLLHKVQRFFDEMIWTLKKESLEICLATLGGDAGCIGAAGLAFHVFQKQELPPVGT